MEDTATKICIKCHKECDISSFYGRLNTCRQCMYEYGVKRDAEIARYDGPITCIHCKKVLSKPDMFNVSSIGNGTCRSCNNLRRSKRRRDRGATFGDRLARLRKSASKRGLKVQLTVSEYRSMVEGTVCHYCGFPLPMHGGGLDRIINSLGYSRSNCIPCCRVCNVARNDHFSVDEMRRIGAVIREIRLERESSTNLAA